MLKEVFAICIAVFVLTNCNGGRKNLSTIADNTQFNTRFKNQNRISPLNNIVAKMQTHDLLEKNYAYYQNKYQEEIQQYYNNKEYIKFITKHDIKKIKNIEVETLPQDNHKYIIAQEQQNSVREINRLAYLEIEYIMFINEALEENERRKTAGDPITHPYVYDKSEPNRHIVMGDEYYKFRSYCEVNGSC